MSDRARPVCVCLWEGKGARGEEKSNPPRAVRTSPFTSQMFPQTLGVGCGPRRVESQHGLFFWSVCARIIICRPAACVNGDTHTAARV